MKRVWSWLRDEGNARAVGVVILGVPALFAAGTYMYSTLWPLADEVIVIDATDFWRTVSVNSSTFGSCPYKLLYNQPPYENIPENAAEYRVKLSRGGRYQLLIEYAADDPRPVDIAVNGKRVFAGKLKDLSKSWCLTRWESVGEIELDRGPNLIRISRDKVFPHLRTLKLIRV